MRFYQSRNLDQINEVEFVRECREYLHALCKVLSKQYDEPQSYVPMAFEKSIMARMWMGKLLGFLDEPNPFEEVDGKREGVKDIVDIPDLSNEHELMQYWLLISSQDGEVKFIDAVRQDLKDMYFDMSAVFSLNPSAIVFDILRYICRGLQETRMVLGMQLHKIKTGEMI